MGTWYVGCLEYSSQDLSFLATSAQERERLDHQRPCLAQFQIRFIWIHLPIRQMYFFLVLTNCTLTLPTVLTININVRVFWNGELVNWGIGMASELEQVYVAVTLLFFWGLRFHLMSKIHFFMLTNSLSSPHILLLSCPLVFSLFYVFLYRVN